MAEVENTTTDERERARQAVLRELRDQAEGAQHAARTFKSYMRSSDATHEKVALWRKRAERFEAQAAVWEELIEHLEQTSAPEKPGEAEEKVLTMDDMAEIARQIIAPVPLDGEDHWTREMLIKCVREGYRYGRRI